MRAELYNLRGEADRSEEALKLALVYDPDSYVLNLALGRAAWKNESALHVERLVDHALHVEPRRAAPWRLRGQMDAAAGKTLAAQQALTRALALEPTTTEGAAAAMDLAVLCAERCPDAALAALRGPALKSTGVAQAWAWLLERGGQLDQAVEAQEKAYALEPRDPEPWARTLERAGLVARAAKARELTVLARPEDPETLERAVEAEAAAGALGPAIAYLGALAGRGDEGQTLRAAEALSRMGYDAEAARALRTLRSGGSDAAMLQAELAEHAGDLDRALSLLRDLSLPAAGRRRLELSLRAHGPEAAQAVAEDLLKRSTPGVLAATGVLAARLLDPERVLRRLDAAGEGLEAGLAMDLLRAAVNIEVERGQAASADQRLARARTAYPRAASTIATIEAGARITQGSLVRAERLLEGVVASDDPDPDATAALARLRAARGGRLLEVDRILLRALADHPDHPGLVAARGRVLVLLGRGDLGLRLLRRAALLDPDDGATWEHLADARERAGLSKDATEAWIRARTHYETEVALRDPQAPARVDRVNRRLGRSRP
ncbi:MAG: hypothetical protein U1E65_31660 [Myxococcota bacterium]